MIFSERRLAALLSIFMTSVFILCVFEYKFMTAAAVILSLLTAALIILRFTSAESIGNKIKTLCGYILFFILPVCAAVLFCVLHYAAAEKPVLKYLEEYGDTPVYIKASVIKAENYPSATSMHLKVKEINGEKIKKFNLFLSIPEQTEAETDDIIEISVIFRNAEDDLTSGVSSAYYKSGGYYISAEYVGDVSDDAEIETGNAPEPIKITSGQPHGFMYYLNAIKNHMRDIFFKNVKFDYHDGTTQEAAVVYGIFCGEKSYISPAVRSDFQKSGISHVLSVSGLHMSIYCGIIFLLLNFFKVHKKIICAVIIVYCLAFMAFTGFSISVIRSGIMTILFYTAFLLGRKSDSVTSLLISGAFIVFLNPYNVLNIGFQLSFFATLGIILSIDFNGKIISALNGIKKFKFAVKILKLTVSSVIVTVAASVFTLPFTSYSFKTLSLVSPLANIATSPFTIIILILSVCIIIFSFIPAVSAVFGFSAYFAAKFFMSAAHYAGSLKYAYISVESTTGDGFYIFAVIFLVSIILCFIIPPLFAVSGHRKIVKLVLRSSAVLMFLMMAGVLIYPRIIFKDSARFAYYSDDKNQNIVLFQEDYDSADIIDITHGTQRHIKPTYDIIPENGASNINSVTLTHYHVRHIQMIKKFMSYSDIKTVYVPEPKNDYDAEIFNSLYSLSLAAGGGKNFEIIKYENYLQLDNALITVNQFYYNAVSHMAIDIDYVTENTHIKLLYLGIGFREAYSEYTEKNYDIVFYGTHKHNLPDGNYTTDIYGANAGVLSGYTDENNVRISQKLGSDAIYAYAAESVLFESRYYSSLIFEVNKYGDITHYLKLR